METTSVARKPAQMIENSALFARFSVGDIQFVALNDGYFPTPPMILAPEVDAAELGKFLAEHGERIDDIRTVITCLYAEFPDGQKMLIDAGMGNTPGPGGHSNPHAGHLLKAMQAAGINPASITTALVSHIHPDHIGGLFNAEGKPNFPNADYYVPSEDAAFWGAEQPDLRGTMMPPPLQMGTVATAKRFLGLAASRMKLFKAGDNVVPGVGSMLLPGHTPGQVGFLLDGGSNHLFYSADAAGHAALSVLRPEWRFAFDTDAPLAIATRKSMIKLLADKGWITYTPHFPWPGVGQIVQVAAGPVWQALR